jgi:hypothetical protein
LRGNLPRLKSLPKLLQDFFGHGASASKLNGLRLQTAPTERWLYPAFLKTIPTLLKKQQIQTYSNQEDCRKGQPPGARNAATQGQN